MSLVAHRVVGAAAAQPAVQPVIDMTSVRSVSGVIGESLSVGVIGKSMYVLSTYKRLSLLQILFFRNVICIIF